MVRKYHRKPGSRTYRDFSSEDLMLAVSAVKRGMTLRAAEQKYKVKRETIRKHVVASKSKLAIKEPVSVKPHGGQTVFSKDEEIAIVKHVSKMAEWGIPISLFELRMIVKSYLSRQGRTVSKFKDGNMPGKDWAQSFMKRHSDKLSDRDVRNINPSRAQVSAEDVNRFFDNFEKGTEDIPPSNIINYDETNLSDDPGKARCIAKRGQKYFTRVMSFTKSSTSVMFACTAAGTVLPPFVVYKAENIYDLWIEGGPIGTRYSCSKSGWFDTKCFEEWFMTIVLPFVRKQGKGEKFVLLGDNLSSHFSLQVLMQCKEHNIEFRCLPPNSTHLLQPLDVAFFAPLKRYWREVLIEYKSGNIGKNTPVQKSSFPKLLKALFEKMAPTMEQAAISGFKKCGIRPLNREVVLKMLPDFHQVHQEEEEDSDNLLSSSFLDFLKETRYPTKQINKQGRKKKVNVAPGKSISVDDMPEETDLSVAGASHDSVTTKRKLTKKKQPQKTGKETVRHRTRRVTKSKIFNCRSLMMKLWR